MSQALDRSFFAHPAPIVAAALIGCLLVIDDAGGIVVETEAYDGTDPASHSVSGPTPRNASMFGPAGHAYVYRSYGLHWCLNLVCNQGSAVLVRAIEPRIGIDAMQARRGMSPPRLLCAGPGRLCQALGVTGNHDGLPLDRPPFRLEAAEVPPLVQADRRIGITRGVETPWRFLAADSPFVSRRLSKWGTPSGR